MKHTVEVRRRLLLVGAQVAVATQEYVFDGQDNGIVLPRHGSLLMGKHYARAKKYVLRKFLLTLVSGGLRCWLGFPAGWQTAVWKRVGGAGRFVYCLSSGICTHSAGWWLIILRVGNCIFFRFAAGRQDQEAYE